MNHKSQMVCDIFSELAPKYNKFNQVCSFGRYKAWLKQVAKEADTKPVHRMLDCASGTGDVAFCVANRCRPEEAVVTDFCEEMLEVAKARYAQGMSNGVKMSFEVEDAMDLPYEDESFDLVTVAYGIRNFEDRLQAMKEAYRVLKEGGRYIILEFSTPRTIGYRELYNFYLDVAIPTIGGLFSQNKDGFEYFTQSIQNFPPREVIDQELHACGFSTVRSKPLSTGIVSLYTATK
ncbi:MAG: bifunctional demethylmenaquinone methyltransferase/2-methoxy-6-polyprenyl-1,4-benzoquinol methylase UbiE [Coriobacteriia bacterium]|nr:bifunctional demethylmenaquinone methyltransferase/2-methoxy-6-polyprenyl-1,4-benzoquinol methylase UbiE [Coriobacteriia bacterium]